MRRVLITGGAQGLGRAMAEIYLRRGDHVTILDIEKPDLNAEYQYCDLAQFNPTQLHFEQPFDIVICNAGISVSGDFKTIDDAQERQVFEINYFGHVRLVKHLFHANLIANEARLGFISSATQYLSFPIALAYAGSKSALDGFAHALESYSIPYKASITRVYPGPMNTAHSKYYPGAQTEGGRRPEQSAPSIVKAIDQRKRKCTPDPASRMYRILSRCIPRVLAKKTYRFYQDRMT